MLSPFQKRKLTRRFQMFDRQRRGKIAWEDVAFVLDNVLEFSGWALNGPEHQKFVLQAQTGWQLLTAAADTNFDGEVDLEEWLVFYESMIFGQENPPGSIPDWLDTLSDMSFEAMDANGDGVISLEEYRSLLVAHGVSEDHIEPAFAQIDINGDGVLSRREWRTLNNDFYLGDDPKAASTWLWGDVYRALFK